MIQNSFFAPLRLALVGIQLVSGVVQAALIFPYVSAPNQLFMKQIWSRQMLWILGIRLSTNVSPEVPDRLAGLLACNHISFVDIFVINAIAPSCFVAKRDVAHWPVIGWFCARIDTLFIERGSRSSAHRTHLQLVKRLEQGHRIAIFPEGTSSQGASVLPFHSALFQSAIDAAVPLRCMALSYHNADGSISLAPAYTGEISLWHCLLSIAQSSGVKAHLRELPAISTLTSERRQLARQAHEEIARGLAANHHEHLDPPQ